MPMMFPIQTKMFQSTYLYKVRRISFTFTTNDTSFNPRTYIRYDTALFGTIERIGVSIHVPI